MNPMKKSSGSQFYIVQGQPMPAEQLQFDQMKLNAGFSQMFAMPENKPLLDSLIAMQQTGDQAAYNNMILKLIPRVEKATGITISRPDVRATARK